ncbi:MAG TPA: cysteine dioxygenase family protein [Phycisphaerae bacterium]|nr:cysteine dioxygenase family protein [Phycisphaerae bacterium]
MSLTLSDFLANMDRHPERVPLDELTAMLERLEISLDDVGEYVQYGPQTYRRNLMHAGPGYHALILCWKNGQRSPIHDHRGSSCGVRVLKGVATETYFERSANGPIYAVSSRELREGQVCGSQDSDIHQISNLQPGDAELVTLHVYSPPLIVMGTYSLDDASVGEFADPIFEFSHGAGI